jgi:hypothetical protein
MRDTSSLFFAIFAIMAIGIAGIIATVRASSVDAKNPYPYKRLIISDEEGHVTNLDIIVDIKELIRAHGDDSKLLRVVDSDAHVVIYFTLNATGDMVTSMHPVPFKDLGVHSNLFKRY